MAQSVDLIGQVFAGRYRIEKLIGKGGMGRVFRAVHVTMNKVVALKIIPAEMAADPENVQRFEREAEAASKLQHPHTIHMFDFGTSDRGELYLAMEFLSGRTLARCIEEDGPFSPARACRVFRQLLESLEEAHDNGIIHRDLKPENIFLTNVHRSEDFVKVLDFGIAKFRRSDQIKQTLTRTGFVCGTPQYLAPEQGLGVPVSPATDLYSAGVVLFEMLTGAPPFVGDDPVSLVLKHIHEAPPALPAAVRANLPDELADLLRRLLHKDPARRPSSATEVMAHLDKFEELSEEAASRPAGADEADAEGEPTLVQRLTPAGDDDTDAPNSSPTLPATPLSSLALRPTWSASAASVVLPPRRGKRVAAMLGLLGLVVVAVVLGTWWANEYRQESASGSETEEARHQRLRLGRVSAEDDPRRDQARRAQEATVALSEPIGAPSGKPLPQEPTDPRREPANDTDDPRREPANDTDDPSRDQARRAQEVTVDPPPVSLLPHKLRLTSTPPAAAVWVDDVSMGTTPIGLLVGDTLEPVRIRVILEGHEVQEWTFVPAEIRGKVGEKEFILAPTAPLKPPPGRTRPPKDGSPFGDLW